MPKPIPSSLSRVASRPAALPAAALRGPLLSMATLAAGAASPAGFSVGVGLLASTDPHSYGATIKSCSGLGSRMPPASM